MDIGHSEVLHTWDRVICQFVSTQMVLFMSFEWGMYKSSENDQQLFVCNWFGVFFFHWFFSYLFKKTKSISCQLIHNYLAAFKTSGDNCLVCVSFIIQWADKENFFCNSKPSIISYYLFTLDLYFLSLHYIIFYF